MPNNLDLCFVGHFANDIIIHTQTSKKNPKFHPKNQSKSLGGGVTYGTLAAAHYYPKLKIGVVSKVGGDFDINQIKPLQEKNIETSGLKIEQSAKTTIFELKYQENSRKIKLLQRAPPITLTDFPTAFFSTKAIHLTPIAQEISHETLRNISNHPSLQKAILGLDIQGLIRNFDHTGFLKPRDGEKVFQEFSPIFRALGPRLILKASDEEACLLTNQDSVRNATEILSNLGVHVFTTLGDKGFIYMHPGGEKFRLNAFQPSVCQDETGAGDCFMAVLLAEIIKNEKKSQDLTCEFMIDSATIASAASSFLIEKPGPSGFASREKIMQRLRNQHLKRLNF